MTNQLVQSVHFLTIDSLHTDDEGQEKESSLPLRLTPQSIPSGLNCPPFINNQPAGLKLKSRNYRSSKTKSNHSAEAERD